MGDIFCGLSARPDLWAFCNGYVAGAGNTTCGALLTCIIFYQASHCELLLVVGVLLDFRHERTLKRRLAGKPYNFSGLLQGANEWGWREEIGPKQCLLSQFRLVRGKSGGRQKREGDFSREISPSLFRLSEIRFGFQITTLVIPESLGTHELGPCFYLTLL